MKMNLSMFLSVVDGAENIKIIRHQVHTLYEGAKVNCPFIDADVVGVWTVGGKIIIEVA